MNQKIRFNTLENEIRKIELKIQNFVNNDDKTGQHILDQMPSERIKIPTKNEEKINEMDKQEIFPINENEKLDEN